MLIVDSYSSNSIVYQNLWNYQVILACKWCDIIFWYSTLMAVECVCFTCYFFMCNWEYFVYFLPGGLDALNIHANEFNYEDSISTGEIIKKVESPVDKAQAFDEILTSYGNDKKNVSVYIGDSIGDLLCLLKVDIGIVVGSSTSLRRLGSHFNVSFVPLFEGLVKKQRECVEGGSFSWKAEPGVLYTASNWSEIHAFILGS